MLSRPSQMRTEPSTLIQVRGLVLASHAIFLRLPRADSREAVVRAHQLRVEADSPVGDGPGPNTEYSGVFIDQSFPGPSAGSGVTKVKEPSPFAVHPSGSSTPSNAQSPRFALLGKYTSVTPEKGLSPMARCR